MVLLAELLKTIISVYHFTKKGARCHCTILPEYGKLWLLFMADIP